VIAKNAQHKLKIGVLMGGMSIEREVSFNSGRTVCDHLDTEKYDIIPLFQTDTGTIFILPWHFLHRGKITDFYHRLDAEATRITWDQLKQTVDFVYISLHGRYGEDGTIQGFLEVLGIPYLGSKVLGCAMGMDKAFQKTVFSAHSIATPQGIVLSPQDIATQTIENILEKLEQKNISLPFIVKPTQEGSSFGVSVVQNINELAQALHTACNTDSTKQQPVLIEEKIEGMEFVCVSLEQQPGQWISMPITQVIPEDTSLFYDYEQKYMPGRATKITPARCSAAEHDLIKETCIKASKALDFKTISRIDGFLTADGRVILIDANALTGMAPSSFLFHQAAEFGMSHTQLINFLIERELEACGLMSLVPSHQEKKDSLMVAKMRIAVLFGGDSNEREISLESGRNICYKLSPHKYDYIPLFVSKSMELYKLSPQLLTKHATHMINAQLTPEMKIEWSMLPELCDFVFIALHGGKGENGSIQGMLELLKLPYNGSGVLASALCMDKFKTNHFLRANGFEVPQSLTISKQEWKAHSVKTQDALQLKINQLSYPLILKPSDDGCSVMIHKVNNETELLMGLDEFFKTDKEVAMLEEFIVGTELTCGILGNTNPTALPPSQVVAKKGILSIEEKFLPGEGENQTPALIASPAIALVQETLVKAYELIGCKGYARIDCFYQTAEQSNSGKERVIILEFNTLPGMTPATCIFHQAAEIGMKPMEFIDKIIELGLENHQKSPSINISARELPPTDSISFQKDYDFELPLQEEARQVETPSVQHETIFEAADLNAKTVSLQSFRPTHSRTLAPPVEQEILRKQHEEADFLIMRMF
jgi:D-alanine--D-alanine ligase